MICMVQTRKILIEIIMDIREMFVQQNEVIKMVMNDVILFHDLLILVDEKNE